MNIRIALFLALASTLAACVPAPVAAPVPAVSPAPAVLPVTPVQGVAGLEERQPDLCKASDYLSVLGRPQAALAGLAITRKYRVVEYRGIEPQEYDPNRVVFRLDAAGNIYNIDCG
jgi:hypothetical protein